MQWQIFQRPVFLYKSHIQGILYEKVLHCRNFDNLIHWQLLLCNVFCVCPFWFWNVCVSDLAFFLIFNCYLNFSIRPIWDQCLHFLILMQVFQVFQASLYYMYFYRYFQQDEPFERANLK